MQSHPWARDITSLIFDLDGVLIQSRDVHAKAFQEELSAFGISDFDYDEFAGWRTSDVFRTVLNRQGHPASEEMIAECSQRKSQRARELISAERPITADCIPSVQRLAAGHRLALASSGTRQSVQAFLDCTGLRPVFQSVLCGEDVRLAKPDPEIFRQSIAQLGAQPGECAVIEDAAAGILAARGAGAHAIGFGQANATQLSAAGAERVVGSLQELTILFGHA